MKHFKQRKQHLPEIPTVEPQLDEPVKAQKSITVTRETELHCTPAEVAERMAEYAGVIEDHEVLDPSAGTGALLRAASHRGASCIAIEKERALAEELRRNPYHFAVIRGDFLKMTPPMRCPDIILMNPPFSKGQAKRHIEHAKAFVRPGGTIVAITPPNQIPAGFEKVEDLPAGTFKTARGIRACIIMKTTDDQ